MLLRLDRLSFLACALVAAAGCVGGQSGTETGGKYDDPIDPTVGIRMSPSGCPCALSSSPALALRARVVSADEGHVRVRVRSVLGEGPIEPLVRFAPGDEIGGASDLGCEPSGLQPGEDVAVLHAPGEQIGLGCPEYRSCMSRRCDALLGDPRFDECEPDCRQQTRAQCTTHAGAALLQGRVVIARWGRELSLPLVAGVGPQLQIPATKLTDLLDQNVCEDLFTSALPDAGAQEPEPPSDLDADPGPASAAAD